MTDEDLAKKVAEGDTESYRPLVEKYQLPLHRYVVFLIRDSDVADDVVQDTFIKAYKNIRGFNHKRKFSSWIYRIAHNTAMDTVRHNRSVQLDDKIIEELGASVDYNTAHKIDADIAAKNIARCLPKLDVKYREPIVLYFIQKKTYQEISDILHISVTAVGVRINRAKQKLHDICKKMGVKL